MVPLTASDVPVPNELPPDDDTVLSTVYADGEYFHTNQLMLGLGWRIGAP